MPSQYVYMKFKRIQGQRYMLVLALIDGSANHTGCQNNVSIGATEPKGVEIISLPGT